MSRTDRLLTAVQRVVRSLGRRPGKGADAATRAAPRGRPFSSDATSPGQAGPDATMEVDPTRLGRVRMSYHPDGDEAPDPGEVIWTWVPYEEHDGRGKDRPVIVVAASKSGDYLAVQLTSKPHHGDHDYVALGSGPWDSAGRSSWADIDRVFRVRAAGMRREAAALDDARYALLVDALTARYGWR